MKIFFKGLGFFIMLVGLLLLLKPGIIIGWMETNSDQPFMYVLAIVMRLTFGGLLLWYSKASRYPKIIGFIGIISILAALVFLIMGQEQFLGFVSSMIPGIQVYSAISAMTGMALGVFIIYAFNGKED
ncbi:MAG: hypothetical protein HKN67_11870 [Saprospiraceae bacterium]|nr:hypothetical protein [Bacteroidia bacterium]NNF22630.1 hypothetical protein [Saprospiraceae bacterium]